MNTTPVKGLCDKCGQPRPLFPLTYGLSLRTTLLCARDWSNATEAREQAVAA